MKVSRKLLSNYLEKRKMFCTSLDSSYTRMHGELITDQRISGNETKDFSKGP